MYLVFANHKKKQIRVILVHLIENDVNEHPLWEHFMTNMLPYTSFLCQITSYAIEYLRNYTIRFLFPFFLFFFFFVFFFVCLWTSTVFTILTSFFINNPPQKFVNLCPYKPAESNATRIGQNLYVCALPVTRRVAAMDNCFVLKVIRTHQHGIVRRKDLVKNHRPRCLLHR